MLVDYDDAPLRPFHLRVCVASTGGAVADGFGLGIIGISLSLAAPQLGLGAAWIGLLGGASLLGLFAGALLGGPVADRVGRRPVFASNMVVAAVLSLLQFWTGSAAELLLLRISIGFVLGTDYVASKTLLIEFVPRLFRGRMLTLLSVAWAGGYASAYLAGVALSAVGPDAWRWMLLASAAPCMMIAPLRATIPESPPWLARRGRTQEAARIVHARFGRSVRPPAAAPASSENRAQKRGEWRRLYSGRVRTHTLVACTFFTCLVIPYFAIGTFITQVLIALDLSSGFTGGLVYNAALFGGSIVGLLVVDRLSRRSFMVGSLLTAALTLAALSWWPQIRPVPMVILFAIFAGVLSAASSLVFVYVPELFPTDLRASGIGLAVAASRIGSAVSTFVLPVIVAGYGARTALGICVAVLAVGAIVCLRWAPETRHLGLEAIDNSSLADASR